MRHRRRKSFQTECLNAAPLSGGVRSQGSLTTRHGWLPLARSPCQRLLPPPAIRVRRLLLMRPPVLADKTFAAATRVFSAVAPQYVNYCSQSSCGRESAGGPALNPPNSKSEYDLLAQSLRPVRLAAR